MNLTHDEKKNLLKIAHNAIESKLHSKKVPPPDVVGALAEPRGAFVTLRLDGSLRGCIGYVEPVESLAATVRDAAKKAAFDDPRFDPLTRNELSGLDVEVSVLTPPERIFSPDEITIGVHGLIVDAGFERGLLLPQVAEENDWNAVEFLGYTAEKAGLPYDAWKKSGVQIFRFTAEKFSDDSEVDPISVSVRLPAVAGLFYSSDKTELTKQVDTLLDEANPSPIHGELIALIVPHAGYQYSGHTAAHAFKLLKGRSYETVILVGPSHHEYFEGISVSASDSYRTPLGDVHIDTALRRALLERGKKILRSDIGHSSEHALEVQLPFLQRVAGPMNILPIVMGDQGNDTCRYLSDVLSRIVEPGSTLLVASSDLSHYHSSDTADKLDSQVIEAVEQFDVDRLQTKLEANEVEACGGGPMVAVLSTARAVGADTAKILHVCNSGDINGDRKRVVGYMSAALVKA